MIEYTLETVRQKRYSAEYCDLCKTKVEDEYKSGTLRVDNTQSDPYDGCQYGCELSLDVCRDCLLVKVLPALKALGLPITIGDKYFTRDGDGETIKEKVSENS